MKSNQNEERVIKMETKNILIYSTTREIQDICEEAIKSLELWGRRLVHEVLERNYGKGYLDYVDAKGNRLIKKDILSSINKRLEDEPDRYPRPIDAITLENIIDIICNQSLYNKHFREIFSPYYHCGKDEVQNYLCIIKNIRNRIHHYNVIDYREAERAICYSHDFVDCVRLYYDKAGKSKDYNVPTFLNITDSLGHTRSYSTDTDSYKSIVLNDAIRSGEVYRIEVEVDPLFPRDSYDLEWLVYRGNSNDPDYSVNNNTNLYFDIKITDEMVGRKPLTIYCKLTSKKTWHRYDDYDDSFYIQFKRVLPPIEETY